MVLSYVSGSVARLHVALPEQGVRLWTVSSWWPRWPPGGQICGLRPGCSLVGSFSLSVQSRVQEGTGLCRALGKARRLVFRQVRGPWLEFPGGSPVPNEHEASLSLMFVQSVVHTELSPPPGSLDSSPGPAGGACDQPQ